MKSVLLLILLIAISAFNFAYSQTWENFTSENSSLPVNYIDNLVIDSNDNIWIHTDSFIFMYSQSEDKWTEFNESNSNLMNGFTHIEIGKDGSVYVSSTNIYKYDSELMNFNIIEENIKCKSFVFDSNGKLYFGNRFAVYVKEDKKNILIYDGYEGGPNYHTDLVIDNNDNLWFSVDGFTTALYMYNGKKLDTLDSIFKEYTRLSIKSISIDRKNNIWLGNGDDSILLSYNQETDSWAYFDKNNSPLGQSWMFSKDLKTGNNNDVWVISSDQVVSLPFSLFKYDGSEWFEYSVDKAFGITNEYQFALLSLAIDSKNNVWIGTNNGLIKFNETTTSVENKTDNDISLYPNPVNDILTIDLRGKHATSYSITDIFGRELIVETTPLSGSTNIDIRALASGTYFISIELSNSESSSAKFVKD